MSKKIVTLFLIIIFIAIVVLIGLNLSKTEFNEENISGNTAGNLLNGGTFCQMDNKVYFSNPKDGGSLYVMDLEEKEYKKLSYDHVSHINVLGKYIYYIRDNRNNIDSLRGLNLNSNGIFRINLNGDKIKALYDDPSTFMNVHGNYVYYEHYDKDGLTFYSVKIDGSEEKKLSDEPILPISIINNTLYYTKTGKNNSISKMNLSNGTSSTIYSKENTYAPVVHDDYIYFISITDQYNIKRIRLNGSDPETIVKESCSTYNISDDGKYLYYQIDDTVNNSLCMMNLETGEISIIKEGNYKGIHITSKYVYFSEYNDTKTYYLPIGATSGIMVFDPPVLE